MVMRLFLVCLMLIQTVAIASVTANVNRTELYDDESLLLTVRISPSGDLLQQDLAALESLFFIEQNFRSDSTQSINGRSTSTREYQFRLRPKKIGALGIPNFRSGSEQSQPILINVLDSRERKDDLSQDAVVLTASLEDEVIYPGQSVTLTIELAYKIQMRNATIAEFNPEGFSAELVDEGQGTEIRDGQSYNIYRRVIRLVSDVPGAYTLPDIRFSAEYPNTNLGRYIRFSRTTAIPSIVVNPIPDEYPKNAFWLPLKKLTLTDNLTDSLTLEQFEHVDWVVQQEVIGQPATRLPDIISSIESTLSPSIKLYRNSPTITDNARQDLVAVSFTEAGNYTLPAIQIPWWNVETDSLEYASLTSRDISVTAATNSIDFPLTAENSATTSTTTTSATDSETQVFWQWLSLFLGVAWASTLAFMIIVLKKKNTQRDVERFDETPQVTQLSPYMQYLKIIRTVSNKREFLRKNLTETEISTLQKIESAATAGALTELEEKSLRVIIKKISKKEEPDKKGKHFELYPSASR